MKKIQLMLAILMLLLCAVSVQAAQLRVFVTEINAIGVANRDEMKATLQMLLSSRLNGDRILAVGSVAEADIVVTGTYVSIGKVFSVDALAKTVAGKSIARSFVQGESQDELIPSVGKLAEKLSAELVKVYAAGTLPATTASTVLAVPVPLAAPKSDFIKNESQVRPAPAGEFIKAADYERNSGGGWQSKRLDGAANLLASVKTCPMAAAKSFLPKTAGFPITAKVRR